MKKNRSLIFLFLSVLLLTSIYLILQKKRDQTKIDFQVDFRIKDVTRIASIHMMDKSGAEIQLTKRPDFWILNDSFRVQKEQIDLLLNTLERMKVKYVPPRAAVPAILKDLAVNGYKVELFGSKNENFKTFYIGGVTSDERGTYGIVANDDYPYVLHIPSWEGSLRPRFVKPLNDWRDRYFIRTDTKQLKNVSIKYPLQQAQSFKLTKKGNKWVIERSHYPETDSNQQANHNLISAYLLELERVGCEAYLQNPALKAKLENQTPYAIISIQETSKQTFVEIYSILQADGSVDPERMHAIINKQELILAQTRILSKILRPYQYFSAQ